MSKLIVYFKLNILYNTSVDTLNRTNIFEDILSISIQNEQIFFKLVSLSNDILQSYFSNIYKDK